MLHLTHFKDLFSTYIVVRGVFLLGSCRRFCCLYFCSSIYVACAFSEKLSIIGCELRVLPTNFMFPGKLFMLPFSTDPLLLGRSCVYNCRSYPMCIFCGMATA